MINNFCNHIWNESEILSKYTHRVYCMSCKISKIAKPRIYLNPLEIPFAANEFIVFKLIELLNLKGAGISFQKVELYKNTNYRFYEKRDMWGYGVALIDDLGNHSRINEEVIKNNKNIEYPDWLYYFDRWIGRLDGNGDNNLLLINNKAVPIDFNLAFSWNNPTYLLKLNNLNVQCHDIIEKNKNKKILEIIKSLKDEEIFNSFAYIDKEFISTQAIISYYSALCLRRDILDY